jgi:dynein intermediate chain 2
LVAVGDAEGTVSIIQVGKPLFDPAPQEKEIMGQIFDREFNREKTLTVNIKKKAEKKGPSKKEQEAENAAKERADTLKDQLADIEKKFFDTVGKDEDISAIKARGEMNKKNA